MSAALRRAADYFLLALVALITAAPFVWMLATSLHAESAAPPTLAELFAPKPDAAGRRWHPENYRKILSIPELPVARFALNTALTAAGVVLLQLVLCVTAAYAFARLRFPGRDALFALFMLTMMVPPQTMIVPLFMLVHELGWLNSYLGLIVPYQYLSTAFGTFLLRQYMVTIPRALDDAARIDGCSDLGILWHVILPCSRPALATLVAFAFIWTWTDFYWPMLATSSMTMRNLEVGLSVFKDSYGGTNWPLQMAAAVVVVTPALVFFLLLQRFFVRGTVMSGVKA